VRENPYVTACVRDANTYQEWILDLQYDHTETEGPLFDDMDMKIKAIASAARMTGIFKLRGADVYRVDAVRKSRSRGA